LKLCSTEACIAGPVAAEAEIAWVDRAAEPVSRRLPRGRVPRLGAAVAAAVAVEGVATVATRGAELAVADA
jgi:hypothetical protein